MLAAVGAALLLAAAVSFLAAAWDSLALTIRVGVIAGVTGAAILGGHRLRDRLPIVGGALFHLGAVLLPVDALGLALQLELDLAWRWLLPAAVAVVALPLLARAGRSPVLTWAAVAAVPALATGAALLLMVPAPAVLAGLGLLGVPLSLSAGASWTTSSSWQRPLQVIAPAAALGAATGPVLLHATAIMAGPLGPTLVLAGWRPTTAGPLVAAAVGASAVLGLLAVRYGRRVVPPAVVSVAALVLTPLLPAASVGSAVVLAPVALLVVFQLLVDAQAALRGVRGRGRRGRPARVLDGVEQLALLLVPVPVVGVLLPMAVAALGGSELVVLLGLGTVAGVLAVLRRSAWTVADRRGAARSSLDVVVGIGVVAVGAAAAIAVAIAVHAARVVEVLGGLPVAASTSTVRLLPAAVLIAAAGALAVLVRPEDPGTGDRPSAGAGPGVVATAVVAAVLSVVAVGATVWRPGGAAVVVAVILVLSFHLAVARRVRPGVSEELVALLTPILVFLAVVATSDVPGVLLPTTTAVVVAVVLALTLLGVVVAWSVGAAGVVVATIAVVALASPAAVTLVSAGSVAASLASGVEVAELVVAVLVAALAAAAMVAVAVAARRAGLAAGTVVPVLQVVLLVAGWQAWSTATTGLVLLVAAVAAALAAAVPVTLLRPVGQLVVRALRPTLLTLSAVAGGLGWLLVLDDGLARGAAAVATGVAVLVVGALRSRPAVMHLGGVLTTGGTWQLLEVAALGSLDLWMLPIAVHLLVASEVSRRRGSLAPGPADTLVDLLAFGLVAAPAIAERLLGGPGWHALLAGGLGALAVVRGAVTRRTGTSVLGASLLLAVVAVELLVLEVTVPTPVWLAAGGAVLLAVAARIESARRRGPDAPASSTADEVAGKLSRPGSTVRL